MSTTQKIPKIIHQIWIGSKPAPTKFMDSWLLKNPDFQTDLQNAGIIQKICQ